MKKILLLFIVSALVLSGCMARNTPKNAGNEMLALSENEMDTITKQAAVLTEVLVISMPPSAANGMVELDAITINSMILYSAKYSGTDYPYSDIYIEDEFYHFPAENVKRVAYELAGKENWILEGGDVEYNQETDRYDTTLAFSLEGYLQLEKISARYEEGSSVVIVSFNLLLPTVANGDPALKDGGSYEVRYSVLNEDGHSFLRFIEMVKT